MKMSCQSWSSVEVTYVHPPHDSVRKIPTPATNLGSVEFGLRVRTYHRPTNATRGPGLCSVVPVCPTVSSLTGCQGNEEHKDGAFGIAVANGRRHGGEPLFGVALWFCEYAVFV
jgi:hypothetical protein